MKKWYYHSSSSCSSVWPANSRRNAPLVPWLYGGGPALPAICMSFGRMERTKYRRLKEWVLKTFAPLLLLLGLKRFLPILAFASPPGSDCASCNGRMEGRGRDAGRGSFPFICILTNYGRRRKIRRWEREEGKKKVLHLGISLDLGDFFWMFCWQFRRKGRGRGWMLLQKSDWNFNDIISSFIASINQE